MSAPMHLEKHLKEPEPTGNHICVKIKLDDSLSKIQDFVQDVTQACAIEKTSFCLENKYGSLRINAASALGVIYAVTEWDELYLVNVDRDGIFNSWVDKYRA